MMDNEETRAWIDTLSEEAQAKLTNPGLLRVDKEHLKEWVEAEDVYITVMGVVLKLRPVSSFLVHERGELIQYPDPPMKMNEDKGREEPDPFDPSYLRAFAQADKDRSDLIMNTYLSFGTEILYIPTTVPPVDDTGWSDKLADPKVLGAYTLDVEPVGTRGRYIQWLKYMACADKDYIGIPTQIQILGGGVRSEVVQRALSSFSGIEERGTNRTMEPNRQQRRNRNTASGRRVDKPVRAKTGSKAQPDPVVHLVDNARD
jgi:hypothetical protein